MFSKLGNTFLVMDSLKLYNLGIIWSIITFSVYQIQEFVDFTMND